MQSRAESVSGSRSPTPPRRSLSPVSSPRVARPLSGPGRSFSAEDPRFSGADRCICLEVVEAGSTGSICCAKCGSPFHTACVAPLLAHEKTCPRCSYNMMTGEMTEKQRLDQSAREQASSPRARNSTAVLMPAAGVGERAVGVGERAASVGERAASVGERASASGLALRFGSSDISTSSSGASDVAWGSNSPRVWLQMHRGQYNPDSTEWELADKMLKKVFQAEQLAPQLTEAQRDLKLARDQLEQLEHHREETKKLCATFKKDTLKQVEQLQ